LSTSDDLGQGAVVVGVHDLELRVQSAPMHGTREVSVRVGVH